MFASDWPKLIEVHCRFVWWSVSYNSDTFEMAEILESMSAVLLFSPFMWRMSVVNSDMNDR